MKVIDFHCDAIYKMVLDDSLSFRDDGRLTVSLQRLIRGNVSVQCFAIYIPEAIKRPSFYHFLEAVDVFYERILSFPDIVPVRTTQQLNQLATTGKIGALLTLEGVDCLEGDLTLVKHAIRLGVRMIGLTWNDANWAADGVLEPRQGGLTAKGIELVQLCNEQGIILDVSHLCERSFWEVLGQAKCPVIASHSNAYHVCAHPRNLRDEQIKALLAQEGFIGLTFVPDFLTERKEATITDLIRHIDHVCSLGGLDQIGFGSDFDGISKWAKGLEHPGKYEQLAIELQKYYNTTWVEQFLYKNAQRFLQRHLPKAEGC